MEVVSTGDRVIVATDHGDVKGTTVSFAFVFNAWYVNGDDGRAYFVDPSKVTRDFSDWGSAVRRAR